MERQGFQGYASEWWHFDYRGWPHYAIGNVPFEDVHQGRQFTRGDLRAAALHDML